MKTGVKEEKEKRKSGVGGDDNNKAEEDVARCITVARWQDKGEEAGAVRDVASLTGSYTADADPETPRRENTII